MSVRNAEDVAISTFVNITVTSHSSRYGGKKMNFEIKLIDGSSYITLLPKEDIQKDQSAIETFFSIYSRVNGIYFLTTGGYEMFVPFTSIASIRCLKKYKEY